MTAAAQRDLAPRFFANRDKPMEDDTLLAHAGRHPFDNHGIVNPPVYHASTVLFPTYQAFRNASSAEVRYGRRGTPTSFALCEAVSALERAHGTVVAPSGLGAITTVLLACTKAGDHVLVTDSTYAPTRQFMDNVMVRYGVEAEYYDPLVGGDIAGLLRDNTAVVWTETPGSQTFEMQDIPAIAEAAHARGAVVVTDNTWGAGYFYRPLEHGADISVQAGTKYIVGHSDVMMGTVACNEATFQRVEDTWGYLGHMPGPDDMYLALRGLRTMAVRLERHHKSGLEIARWLAARPEVARVMHPGLESDPGHGMWKRDFTGSSGLFGFVLNGDREDAVAALLDGLEYFGMGYSWGGFESLLIPTWPGRARTATSWDPAGQSFRMHVGLEDTKDLIADLEAGLERFNAAL